MAGFIINYWLEFAFGFVVAALAVLQRRVMHQIDKQKAIEAGVCALLLETLHSIYHEGLIERVRSKGVEPKTMERFEEIYKQYKALGGDGVGTRIYEMMHELPMLSQWGQSIDGDVIVDSITNHPCVGEGGSDVQ